MIGRRLLAIDSCDEQKSKNDSLVHGSSVEVVVYGVSGCSMRVTIPFSTVS